MGRLNPNYRASNIGFVDSTQIPNSSPPPIVFNSTPKKEGGTDILQMIKSIASLASGLSQASAPATTGEDLSNSTDPLGYFGINQPAELSKSIPAIPVPYQNATGVIGEKPESPLVLPYNQLAPYSNAVPNITNPVSFGENVYKNKTPFLQNLITKLSGI